MKAKSPINVKIRNFSPKKSSDIGSITKIYTHHVLTGTASFEIIPPNLVEMTKRINNLHAKNYPILVAESINTKDVIGFAYCSPYHSRAAYDKTVQDSIYLHKDKTGIGIGRILLKELIKQTLNNGFSQIVAVIGDTNNARSIGLHSAMGFTKIGTAKKIGFKFNKFIDVVYMQLDLTKQIS
mgnify:CR=1 FL=1